MNAAKGLKSIVIASIILSFVVILLGAYTRLKDAGLGCPDWPGCYGQLTAPKTPEAISLAQDAFPGATIEYSKANIEMVHRYFAGSLGLLIAIMAFLAVKARRKIALPMGLPLTLVGLVCCQALLGMLTVTMRLNPPIVLMHLIGGLTTISLLWLCWLYLKKNHNALFQASHFLNIISIIALAAVMGQILLGGWVSTNYAALICTDFPACQGHWLPNGDVLKAFPFWDLSRLPDQLSAATRINIQLTHRLGALLVTLLVLVLTLGLWQQSKKAIDPRARRWFKRSALLLVGLLATQLALGITNVLALLPVHVAVSHNGVAVLLLLMLINIKFTLSRSGQ